RGVWDDDLLGLLSIPRSMLATPVRSSGVVAEADAQHFGRALPIAGVAGDQQAALFGQTCFAAGEAKNTYGTGCFLLVNTADRAALASGGLLTTIAWDTGDGIRYALEASAFITGAAVQWLRDGRGIIATAAETESLAPGLPGNGNVYLGPAFTGLGAGVWKSPDDLRRRRAVAARYEPRMSADERESLYAGWQRAVDRSRGWAAAGI